MLNNLRLHSDCCFPYHPRSEESQLGLDPLWSHRRLNYSNTGWYQSVVTRSCSCEAFVKRAAVAVVAAVVVGDAGWTWHKGYDLMS